MDYLAHGLWSYLFFHTIKKPWKAVFFGILPDTLSWLIYFFYLVFTNQLFGRPDPAQVPFWVDGLYKATHSLVLFVVILLVVFFYFKRWEKVPKFIYAYPIHIFLDIPTHSRSFLPTPFLWPLSDWKFPGISWGEPWFMLLNYGAILALLWYLVLWRKKKKK